MKTGRLEAFSDGVFAIIITIMVLELRPPHGAELSSLQPLVPAAMSYVLSFIYLGIYWNNHHHLFQLVDGVNGAILWANLHLLFWLSLVPVTTAWIGHHGSAPWPAAVYGGVLLMAAIAYFILVTAIIRHQGEGSKLAEALQSDFKGKISIVIYAVAVALAFVRPWMADTLYVLVALIWLVPDRRIESRVHRRRAAG